MTIKRLTFVRRAAGVTAEEFAARWRAEAQALQAAGARWDGLAHCVVRTGRADRPFHGVAIEWFGDDAALAAHDAVHARGVADLGAATVIDGSATVIDGSATVRARVSDRAVFGQSLLDDWWRVADAAPRMVLLGVIHRKPTLTREQFADYWWTTHRPLADRLLPADVWPPIYVHDYVLPGEAWPWDGVGEFYEDSLAVAKARTEWADGEDAAAIVADEEAFLVRDTRWSLVTDAVVVVPRV